MSENQKKVWITGASSGIGKAVAEKFAKQGWRVAVSARRKEILDDMAKTNRFVNVSILSKFSSSSSYSLGPTVTSSFTFLFSSCTV